MSVTAHCEPLPSCQRPHIVAWLLSGIQQSAASALLLTCAAMRRCRHEKHGILIALRNRKFVLARSFKTFSPLPPNFIPNQGMEYVMDFVLNGEIQDIPDEWAEESLLNLLRDHFGLVGAKYGCGAGICGACRPCGTARSIEFTRAIAR